jgi:hypothetical protein
MLSPPNLLLAAPASAATLIPRYQRLYRRMRPTISSMEYLAILNARLSKPFDRLSEAFLNGLGRQDEELRLLSIVGPLVEAISSSPAFSEDLQDLFPPIPPNMCGRPPICA